MSENVVLHYAEAVRRNKAERIDRSERLWLRFAVAMKTEGHRPPRKPPTPSSIGRAVRWHLVRGYLSEWEWESVIEYTEVAEGRGRQVPFPLTLGEPTPIRAIAGTDEKLEELARRAERGEELFSPSDGWDDDD